MTTSLVNSLHTRPLAALALLSVVTAAAALAIGYWPTRSIGGPESVPAMAAGIAVALIASLAGLVPPLLVRGMGAKDRALGLLAGTGVRFVMLLALLLVALLGTDWPKRPLALWAVIAYLALLAVDTIGLARWGRRPQGNSMP